MTSVHHLGGGWPGDPRHWGIHQTRLHGRARILTSFCFGQSHKQTTRRLLGVKSIAGWARMLECCSDATLVQNGTAFGKQGAASWQPCRPPRHQETRRQVPSGRFSLGLEWRMRQAALQRRSGITGNNPGKGEQTNATPRVRTTADTYPNEDLASAASALS